MFSAAIKGWKLATRAFSKGSKRYCRKQQCKIFWYALIHPAFASRWFETLHSDQCFLITMHRPRLYVKPFRVYMSTRWNKNHRVKVILDTYEFIRNNGKYFMQVITGEHPCKIASFELKDGSLGTLTLGYDERYRKEGELVIFFECEQQGGYVAGASFSFENTLDAGWVCRIGCIQGYKKKDDDMCKTVQKLMHGLRPKSLMVFAVSEFARFLGVRQVYGAGQSIQAFRGKHAIHIQWLHRINFDYNKLWLESGGRLEEDGWFILPTTPQRKCLHEVTPSKRANYRRRYQMMDEISNEIYKNAQEFISSCQA